MKYETFEFTKQIFMGSGAYSMAECYKAHRLLEKAFEFLGGLQQPGDPTIPGDVEHVLETQRIERYKLRQYAAELVMAITGEEIEFKEKNN